MVVNFLIGGLYIAMFRMKGEMPSDKDFYEMNKFMLEIREIDRKLREKKCPYCQKPILGLILGEQTSISGELCECPMGLIEAETWISEIKRRKRVTNK